MVGVSTDVDPAGFDAAGFGAAVARIKALDSVEVAFAARLDRVRETFVLGEFLGSQTDELEGLISPIDAGLGGRCITLGKPVYVSDYVDARGITHQHDRPVTLEGLRAVFAVPVHDSHGVHGVVYGAARRPLTFGDRLLGAAVRAARSVLPGIRGAAATPFTDASGAPLAAAPAWTRHDLQELHAELRAIAGESTDPRARTRLHALSERLSRKAASAHATRDCPVTLSPRELDVLTEVAVGCGNAQVAARLGLSVETTKSYLKSAMSKLDSHNRVAAVHRARQYGLLP